MRTPFTSSRAKVRGKYTRRMNPVNSTSMLCGLLFAFNYCVSVSVALRRPLFAYENSPGHSRRDFDIRLRTCNDRNIGMLVIIETSHYIHRTKREEEGNGRKDLNPTHN